MRGVRIRITGKVQGVGFRYHASRQARALGLAGFVRNLADGGVYAEAEGGDGEVDAFVDWCRRGPPDARVDNVEVTPAGPFGHGPFSVRA